MAPLHAQPLQGHPREADAPSPARQKLMARRAPLLFFLLCAAFYFHETVVTVIPDLNAPSDFKPYHEAARDILAGRTPFVTQGYIYPPLLAYLLTPLAPLSYLAARWVWFL